MNKIIICTYDENLLPEKKTPESVCWDLMLSQDEEINPMEIKLFDTGIKSVLPEGWSIRLHARSSTPLKNGLILANGEGIIDADYRGKIKLQFLNVSGEKKSFAKYTRLGQMEIEPYYIGSGLLGTNEPPILEVIINKETYDNFEEIFSSERGAGGFGSTGHK